MIHSTEPRGVPLTEVLLPERLREVGYKTIALGKWHLGFHQTQYLPQKRGFDEFYGILTGGGDHFAHTSTGSFVLRGPEYKTTKFLFTGSNMWHNDEHMMDSEIDGFHSTDIYTQKAIEFLRANEDSSQPWFMYLAYQAVHAPMQAVNAFTDGTIQNGCHELKFKTSDRQFATMRRKLCGMVSMVDQSTQTITGRLKESGKWDETVLIFLSDNGGIVRHGSSNAPLRGEKGQYYEGGIRVPAFFSGGFVEKELLRTNTAPYASKALCHVTDVFATILAVAGSHIDPGDIDGVNQWDSLVSSAPSARGSILHNINSDLFGNAGALRVGDYKLIVESRVTESEIYSYGQSMLQDSDWDMDELSQVIHQKLLRTPGNVYLFNIAMNPSEDESGDCNEFEACNNLYEMPEYTEIQEDCLAKWQDYANSVPSSTEAWVDDGPLADPKNFGGYWTPWRDESGIPFATYQLAEETHHLTLMEHEPVPAMAQMEANGAPGNIKDAAALANANGVPDDGSYTDVIKQPIASMTKGTEDDQRRRLSHTAIFSLRAGPDPSGLLQVLLGVCLGVAGTISVMKFTDKRSALP